MINLTNVIPSAQIGAKDYIKDKLIYCGHCNTAKEMYFNFSDGTVKKVPIMCKCKEQSYTNAETGKADAEAKEKLLKFHARYSDIAIADAEATLDNAKAQTDSDRETIRRLKNYVDNWERVKASNLGLLFWGDVGTGKTFYASCIVNALKGDYNRIKYATLSTIIGKMGFDTIHKTLEEIEQSDLLVIDDLGTERQSAYAMEQVFTVIDTRYKANKPMVITTNLALSEIKTPQNLEYKRIYDRILEVCTPIKITGESKRTRIGKERLDLAKQILG